MSDEAITYRRFERAVPCPGPHPKNPDLRCVYPDGHFIHYDGEREIWLSPTLPDEMAIAAAEARGRQQMIDALRDAQRFERWWDELPHRPAVWLDERECKIAADYLDAIANPPRGYDYNTEGLGGT